VNGSVAQQAALPPPLPSDKARSGPLKRPYRGDGARMYLAVKLFPRLQTRLKKLATEGDTK